MTETTQVLLRVNDLQTVYPVRSSVLRRPIGEVRAVDHVSFDVHAGETVGLVGESGSGKSTIARTIVGLTPATGGSVSFDGTELVGLSTAGFRRVRRRMQMVYQDPYSSLNPRFTVQEIIEEGWRIHDDVVPRRLWGKRVRELLERVGLNPDHATRYPHQFSGGQRQRIGIARALALETDLIICDEAVSALDVSVQAQVLNLLEDLQRDLGLAYLFIAHDLSVVRHLCDRVLVLSKGQVVEQGDTDTVFEAPQHEYTRRLLDAVPVVRPWEVTR
ncbi:ABC transporter ATP-binding protein [Microbacterium sp. OR16]|uniref:ABC transporter ATP-binding protein n=1 Tax=Microbacterium sp. OR16 TaxID=3095345 RepID=UPI0039B4A1F9